MNCATAGVHDILIAVVDGLEGVPRSHQRRVPQAQVQTCIVHLLAQFHVVLYHEERPQGGGNRD